MAHHHRDRDPLDSTLKLIPLSQGQAAEVDDDMFDFLNQWKWSAHHSRRHWYAQRSAPSPDGKNQMIWMHRVILDAPEGVEVDHVDGDGLRNLRSNLRFATHAGNMANSTRQPSSSGYRGVRQIHRRWGAQISRHGRSHYLGSFTSPEEAARAYDIAAWELFGEFARLNFPPTA